jgi:hypothetical protein
MNVKPHIDFGDHKQWTAYVRHEVPPQEQGYVLALGRTELFKRFYETRGRAFPEVFRRELDRIETLNDPERTTALVSLNDRIFTSLTSLLFADARPALAQVDAEKEASGHERAGDVLNELSARNPYLALCTGYRRAFGDRVFAAEWDRYLRRKLGSDAEDEIGFARSMMDMDTLLRYYRDKNLRLPRHFRDRAWFLHYLREPERSVQTHAILSTLAREIEACTSA